MDTLAYAAAIKYFQLNSSTSQREVQSWALESEPRAILSAGYLRLSVCFHTGTATESQAEALKSQQQTRRSRITIRMAPPWVKMKTEAALIKLEIRRVRCPQGFPEERYEGCQSSWGKISAMSG